MPKLKLAKDIPLVSVDVFKNAVRNVLTNSKQDSDKQLEEFQAANVGKRR
jgi:hypothetical protein